LVYTQSVIKSAQAQKEDTMPSIDFGEQLPKAGGTYVNIKNAGDKVQFRILAKPFVEGNHFFGSAGNWDVQPCLRINNNADCVHCNRLTVVKKAIPKTESKEEYDRLLQIAKKSVPGCDPGITFNFPIINRNTEVFAVYGATTGVRNKIDAELKLGTKVLEVDFLVLNTGNKGKDKFSLTRLDSAFTRPLSEKENAIKSNFVYADFEKLVDGSPDDEGAIAFEQNSEVRDDGDVPF